MKEGDVRGHVKRRVIEEVFLKPAYSLIPMAAGLTILMGAWAMDAKSLVAYFLGLGLSLASAGVYATWAALVWGDKEGLQEKILREMNDAARRSKQHELNSLRDNLVRDRDPRTQRLLDTLVELTDLIRQQSGPDYLDALDTFGKIDELFDTCIAHLKETYSLYRQIQGVSLESVQDSLRDRREKLIQEVQTSVEALGKILITFNEIESGQRDNGAERLREQLAMQLRVARNVDKQIRSWEDPEDSFLQEMKKAGVLERKES